MNRALLVAVVSILPTTACLAQPPQTSVEEVCNAAAARDMPGQEALAREGCACLAGKAPEGSALARELQSLLQLSHEERMLKSSPATNEAMAACFG